jgi:hypothetical protein
MRPRTPSLATSVAVVALALFPAGRVDAMFPRAPASASSSCGTVAGEVPLYNVSAKGVTCRLARRVARRWEKNVFDGRCTRFRCTSGGFHCRARPPARVDYRVRCVRSTRRVGFEVVVD